LRSPAGLATRAPPADYSDDGTDGQGIAIANSGDYYQIKKFGLLHIPSPTAKTVVKAGSRTRGSVSIMAVSCALAEGIATAAMTCNNVRVAA
jgi:thiamine biosynthesis lipoprotein ApbE